MSQTKPLIALFDKDFIIPHYQRGYRWGEQEVTELLNDIWYFTKTSNNGEFYCLQPIVVQKEGVDIEEKYIVLDGQQRLTTLYLIIMFLEERRFEDGYNQPLFRLKYETRPNSESFLKDKKFKEKIDDSNIDFDHISKSYNYIKSWFHNHAGAKSKMIPVLLDDNGLGNRNIRFIWYQVPKSTNPIDVFIRLNVGKIPLTDAELIKALLLQSDKYPKEDLKFIKMMLFEIASEWDSIEYTLQQEEFWYFLNNKDNTKPTHIEFIFDAIAQSIEKEHHFLKEFNYLETKNLKHATFLILAAYLEDQITNRQKHRIEVVKEIWDKITAYFEYFKEWFNNRELFHYIGYLIEIKGAGIIDAYIANSKKLTKTEFVVFLEEEISKVIKVSGIITDNEGKEHPLLLKHLCYEDEVNKRNDKPLITRILFLHNVVATQKSEKEKAKFPFNLYKKTKENEKWSLEHIHARNSDAISNADHQKSWLKEHIKSVEKLNKKKFKKVLSKMKKVSNKEEIEQDEFDDIYNEVYDLIDTESGINDKNKHLISNLCLLDANTNSALNKAVFDVKREIIKQRELKGFYIPVSSRNVFLKAYTSYSQNNAYWTDTDREDYLESIVKTYNYFVRN
ncbi:DUF262 domain-containing protein [Mariniflexile aquimaris]|uniref:DUF262 domain-containing protein n=1 Tax=Mariniflexile aquimaris TaxID=881009 RepID=A0ABW3BVG2_9FLAO